MGGIDGMTRETYAGAFLAGKAGGLTGAKDTHTPEERQLLQQLSDPNSSFYVQMRLALLQKGKKHKEDEEEQDRIEAMLLLLDAMNGRVEKKDLQKLTSVQSLSGEDRERELPWSIQVYLMGLAGGGDLTPEDEEREKELSEAEQISGKAADDLRISSFYGTIYKGGLYPGEEKAADSTPPDLAAREALWWTGQERP